MEKDESESVQLLEKWSQVLDRKEARPCGMEGRVAVSPVHIWCGWGLGSGCRESRMWEEVKGTLSSFGYLVPNTLIISPYFNQK